jgi:hypothetical protein
MKTLGRWTRREAEKAEEGGSGYSREISYERRTDQYYTSDIRVIKNSPTFELASVRLFSVVDFPLEG